MKKLLFLALFSAALSAAQAEPKGTLLSLKPKHQGLAAAIDIEEEKTKASIRSLPKELQELVLLQTYLEKIEAGTLFDSSNQSATKKAAYQLERALRGVYKTHAASARMLIKALIDNNQLIPFLDHVDVNKLPQEMIEMIIDEAGDKKFKGERNSSTHKWLGAVCISINIDIFELLSRYTDNKHFAWLQQHKNFPVNFNPGELIKHNDIFDQVDLIYDAVKKQPAWPREINIASDIKNPRLLKNYIEEDFLRTHTEADDNMLFDAIRNNPNPEIIKALVELGFIPNASYCGTPLIYFAINNKNALGIIQELIKQRANVNARGKRGPQNLLLQVIQAASFGSIPFAQAKEIAKLLLKHGVSTERAREKIIMYFEKKDPIAKKELLALIAPYEPW